MNSVLDRPTLILNKACQPVHVRPVSKALKLVWKERAEIIDTTTYNFHTWTEWSKIKPSGDDSKIYMNGLVIRAPEICRLVHYDRVPKTMVTFNRINLYKRDKYQCQYCLGKPGTKLLTIDHVIPRSKGGTSSFENCVVACVSCNRRKSNRLLDEIGYKLKKRPVQPAWHPMYAYKSTKLESWKAFISDVYWNIGLE